MHPKVLTKEAWSLVRKLALESVMDGWLLAGGTGLALQFGHRYSEDLDLFTVKPFDPQGFLGRLTAFGKVKVQDRSDEALHVFLDGVRFSFLRAQADFLFPGIAYRGLTVADPREIAVMKLIAIGGRGSRKDFVDLYFLFRCGISLETSFDLLRKRFQDVDYNEYHLMKSLVYFNDAEAEPMPSLIEQVSWNEIKKAVVDEVKRLA